jgi:hypothetical protein
MNVGEWEAMFCSFRTLGCKNSDEWDFEKQVCEVPVFIIQGNQRKELTRTAQNWKDGRMTEVELIFQEAGRRSA